MKTSLVIAVLGLALLPLVATPASAGPGGCPPPEEGQPCDLQPFDPFEDCATNPPMKQVLSWIKCQL